jgi:hypothetical protein
MYEIIIYIICLAFGGLIGFALNSIFSNKDIRKEIKNLTKRLTTYEQEITAKKKPHSDFKDFEDIEDI